MTEAVWEVRGLEKRFGGGLFGARRAHVALDKVSFAIGRGERVALIGESGSGKTTLARVGLGLIRPDAGTIHVLGEDATTWSEGRWRAARRQVQLLFQDPRSMLHPNLALRVLLRESARLHRPEADADVEVGRVLAEVGLTHRADALPHQMSGGEQRRAGVARLLLARPLLVVADEPTAGLDAALKANLLELLLSRVGPECAVVLISHDLAVVSWACERAVVMHEGRVVDSFATRDMGGSNHDPHTLRLLAAAGLQ